MNQNSSAILVEYHILQTSGAPAPYFYYHDPYLRKVIIKYMCAECGAKISFTIEKDFSKPLTFKKELCGDCLCGNPLIFKIPQELL